uniref:3-beta hydroxysteroid dehydrogenase/isomerase domain-containing protein n=1 Tax=Oryza brachyantha TaxID=4533 RepID=J3LPL9_ORYBR
MKSKMGFYEDSNGFNRLDSSLILKIKTMRSCTKPTKFPVLSHLKFDLPWQGFFQGVDAVFHTAAANPDINNFQLHYKVNVEGTKNVINACVKCNVKRLIHTSSSGVVFDGIHGLFDIDESVPYPDTFPDAYAQSKAEAEKLVTKANGKYELMTCSIRPGSIFGPGGVMVPYLRSYGRMMVIIGNGKNCDDFVYVENVVHGHICAEKTLSTQEGSRICGGKAYFITNMEPMNLWDFIFMFLEELGYKRKFKIRIPLAIIKPIAHIIEWSYNKVFHVYGMHQPKLLTPARLKYISLDRTFSCRKAVEQLGYKPLVSLKDGIKITINSAIGPNI